MDALPNGPIGHPTVRVFLAGGVPEVMLHLRDLGLLALDVLTVSGHTLGDVLDWWQSSDRRKRLRDHLATVDKVDPDTVIMSPAAARKRGLTSTVTFPRGNLCPDGSVIKSTAIDPSVCDADGVYRKTGPAKVFTTETAAIAAIKGQGDKKVEPGDVLVLCWPRPDGQRDGGDVSGHVGPQAPAVGQAGGRDYRRPVQRREHRAPASATSPPRPSPAARSANCATATPFALS